jgi:hypothetical protein
LIDGRPEAANPAERHPAEAPAALSAEALGQLQAAMLDALCSGTPLAGHQRALAMPDLSYPSERPPLILSSDNLGGPIELKHAGAVPLQILPQQAIQERAQRAGALTYLHFEPPQRVPQGVRLTLQLRTAQPGPGRQPDLGMSAVQVSFQQSGQGWRALDDTAALSA